MLGTRTRLELHNAVHQYHDAKHTLKQAQYRLNDVEPSEHEPYDDGYNSGRAWCAALGYTLLGVLIGWLVVAWI